MKLITRHPLEFDITKDIVDISKSSVLGSYFDYEKMFSRSYKWLFDQIGYDKLIWCYNAEGYLSRNHGEEYVEWTLEVPESDCVFINEEVWNLVINNMPYFVEMNSNLSDSEFDRLMEFHKPIKEKTWADNIFKINGKANDMQILIKSPIPEKWVVDKKWICAYNTDVFASGIIRNGYATEKETFRYLEIMESGLKGRKIPYTADITHHDKVDEGGYTLLMEWKGKDD
jgi:hypothetical protein